MRTKNQKSIVASPPSVNPQKTFKNRVGEKYERLRVIKYLGRDKWNKSVWLCRCACTTRVEVTVQNLVARNTTSCGCLQSEMMALKKTKHKLAKTKLYCIRATIIARCENPTCRAYHRYGGRGIRMCDGWRNGRDGKSGSECFVEDVKRKPRGRSIDRVDNNGHYSCGRCRQCRRMGWKRNWRWATQEQQGNNKRNNHRLTLNGVTRTASQWARKLGMPVQRISQRKSYGWPDEKILTTPRFPR